MKHFIGSAALVAAIAVPAAAQAFVSGDITGGGSFDGTLSSASAWINANPIDGTEVNFWTFAGNAGDTWSFVVTPREPTAIEFGMSLYFGPIAEFDLLVPGFDNEAGFADAQFIAGTPAFGALGTTLVDIVLAATGTYTLAIGGEEFAAAGSEFGYTLDANVAPVPVPAAAWLMASALAGFGAVRRRR
ncbi:MAG: VPLPA-CTERM sorting domain-containing protein [Gammaproteobacteria bacterium]